jgi:hypothetical protein
MSRAKQLGLKLIYPTRFDVVPDPVKSHNGFSPTEKDLVQIDISKIP